MDSETSPFGGRESRGTCAHPPACQHTALGQGVGDSRHLAQHSGVGRRKIFGSTLPFRPTGAWEVPTSRPTRAGFGLPRLQASLPPASLGVPTTTLLRARPMPGFTCLGVIGLEPPWAIMHTTCSTGVESWGPPCPHGSARHCPNGGSLCWPHSRSNSQPGAHSSPGHLGNLGGSSHAPTALLGRAHSTLWPAGAAAGAAQGQGHSLPGRWHQATDRSSCKIIPLRPR